MQPACWATTPRLAVASWHSRTTGTASGRSVASRTYLFTGRPPSRRSSFGLCMRRAICRRCSLAWLRRARSPRHSRKRGLLTPRQGLNAGTGATSSGHPGRTGASAPDDAEAGRGPQRLCALLLLIAGGIQRGDQDGTIQFAAARLLLDPMHAAIGSRFSVEEDRPRIPCCGNAGVVQGLSSQAASNRR